MTQQYLDRQTALGNASKYDFLTGKYVLLGKNLLEKTGELERFGYFP